MGRSSRARREARRRSHPRTAGTGTDGGTVVSLADIETLIDRATAYAVRAPHLAALHVDRLNEIGAAASSSEADPAAIATEAVISAIGSAWERGWQPLDLVHATKRRTSKPVTRWMTQAVLEEARLSGAGQRAPQAWLDQLRALSARAPDLGDAQDLLALEGSATSAEWTTALAALGMLRTLPPSQLLVPPPSRWDVVTPRRHARPDSSGARARMLAKVRLLLAKAESTDFVAEADALTAKAQDLMARHSIDEALLADDGGDGLDVEGRRVLVDQPYALEKATLLHVVADANRVRAVWSQYASYVTLVGVASDVEQVDVLFTSTLVQATRAMTQADHSGVGFRKAFLHAFATRLGERLAAASDDVLADYGSALVPVLRRQEEAIDSAFGRLFPHVTAGARRASFDARGWDAGTRAADAAVLPAGAVEG